MKKYKRNFIFVILALILVPLVNHFYVPPVDISKNTSFTVGDMKSASDYLNQLPSDEKIFIFPSKERAYEIIGSFAEIRKYLSDYQNQSGVEYDFHQVTNFSQVLIISDNTFFESDPIARKKYLESVSYPFEFTSALTDMKLGDNDCYAQTIQDRNVWTLSAFIAVGPHSIAGEKTTTCALAALDYINGFPVRGEHFDLNAMPLPNVRKPIMYFMHECAFEGRTTAEVGLTERSRGPVTALPSLQCIKEKIASAAALTK